MNICLIDADSKIPNLALMKISAWHKAQGDQVSWYNAMFHVKENKPDKIYASKVFTFTEDYHYFPHDVEVVKGGTGYDIKKTLPDEIETICPDYSLYDMDHSLGFLTRGCPNKCSWCFVPKKEGNIRPAQDIEEFLRHDKAILADNNVLAHDWGIKQIEKIIKLKVKVDFNQGLDARLINDSTAKLLSKVRWLNPIRLACDTEGQMKHVQKAVELLRWYNATPARYSCYVLLKPGKIDDCLKRVKFLKGICIDPFVQPFQPPKGRIIPQDEKDLARYCDMKATFKSVWWEDYKKTGA
ncbi:MAG: hypothetical protein AWM53_02008 [Candidatus Dichloromethanomonas elyunquensis]|nr:MAG: hypothetical protein AWM53_02008 [Candidatus Dichloromethanomonas elyunquensis]